MTPLNSHNDSAVFISLCIALFVCVLAITYTFFVARSFPLWSLIRGVDAFTLAQMRADFKFGFKGVAAIKDLLAINLILFLSLTCYAYKLIYRKGKFNLLFYISFFLAFIMLTHNLEKAPIFLYLLSLVAIKVIYNRGISLKKVVAIITPLVILVYFVFSIVTDVSNPIEALMFRVFIAQSVAIFQGFEYFPQLHDFIGVNGISRFFSFIVGGEVVNSGRVLFEIYSPAAIENNTAGMIVGLFNAEAWMLFGFFGVVLAPIYVGFFVQTLNLFFLRAKKTPLIVALYVYFWTKLSLAGSVAQFLYPIMIISILLIFMSIISFSKIIALKRVK